MAETRVLLVLATSTGGVGGHVRSLATGLVAAGARVTVAGPASTQQVFNFSCFEVVPIGSRPDLLRELRALLRLGQLRRSFDVVHAHGLRAGALAAAAGGFGRPGTGPPLVVTWHNESTGRLGRLLQRYLARRTDVTLGASPELASLASRSGGRDVRFAPVAAPALQPSGQDPGLGHPLVLAVGRLHPQKGYDTLLAALPMLTECVVAVAGDGPLRAQLAAAAPDVRWLGRRADVADLLAAADVVVLPSSWEARSLTAQEALRAGRPLVATAVGGLPELLADGAVLVPPGDPHALGQAIRTLLDDPHAAQELARRGRAVAAGWPDEQDTVQQVAAVYAELLG